MLDQIKLFRASNNVRSCRCLCLFWRRHRSSFALICIFRACDYSVQMSHKLLRKAPCLHNGLWMILWTFSTSNSVSCKAVKTPRDELKCIWSRDNIIYKLLIRLIIVYITIITSNFIAKVEYTVHVVSYKYIGVFFRLPQNNLILYQPHIV
jgi:hypothetical protein